MQPLTKRQREILDYLNEFIEQHGYAPSLEEIGRRFGLSSLATVHKHLTNLQDKGFIRRAWNRSRSVELVPTRMGGRALDLPLLPFDGGHIAIAVFEKLRNLFRSARGMVAAAPVNYLKLMPATYVVLVVVAGYMLLTVTADFVNPIRPFQ